MARRWIPRVCGVVFVAGIAGLIIASVNGNNAGYVLSIGLGMVLAAVALLTYGAVTAKDRLAPFDDAAAEQLEAQVAALVATGAPEDQVRALVRDAMRISRR
jgi:ABC-type nickel/cobalt efflux system permease component RcnA